MAAASKRIPSKSWAQPFTAKSLADGGFLDVSLPERLPDIDTATNQSWRIFMLRRIAAEDKYQGHISMSCKPDTTGVKFTIAQASIQGPQRSNPRTDMGCDCNSGGLLASIYDIRAELNCRSDQLLTPTSWWLQSSVKCSHGNIFPHTALKKNMKVTNGNIHINFGGNTTTRKLPAGNLTSNWSLLYALSYLDSNTQRLDFTLLDELDKIKNFHRLYRSSDTQIRFAGQDVPVRCYHQIGRATLPWEYYVDKATNRVLLAISGLRAYIFDADAASKTTGKFSGYSTSGANNS